MNTLRFAVVAIAISLVGGGCGGGIDRTDISGAATFDGQPIVYGDVLFISRDGPAGTAQIRDGKYNTAGQGIVFGPHSIQVTAYSSAPSSEVSVEGAVGSEASETAVNEEAEKAGKSGSTILFNGYTYDANIDSATFDIAVPADATGFDLNKTSSGEGQGEGSEP